MAESGRNQSPADLAPVKSVWRERKHRLLTFAAPVLIAWGLRVLGWTVRMEYLVDEEPPQSVDGGERVIAVFWHSGLVAMALAATKFGLPICILVSQHRDGEIASRAAQRSGIHVVRGSATRGGVGGFRRLVEAHRQGFHLAIVPDGPRGPAKKAKAGVVHLARATGAEMLPLSCSASRAWRLRSWDRLMIPKPFSKVTIRAGAPARIASDMDREHLERARQEVEQRLGALERSLERGSD